jgi:hypothetical protein
VGGGFGRHGLAFFSLEGGAFDEVRSHHERSHKCCMAGISSDRYAKDYLR